MGRCLILFGVLLFAGGIVMAIGAFMTSSVLESAGVPCEFGGCGGAAVGIGGGAFALLVTGAVLSGLGWLFHSSQKEAANLRAVGVPGTATIRSVRPTGTYFNESPMATLDLALDVGGHVYEVKGRNEFVPQVYLARLVPGGKLPVIVDPTNPRRFIVEWERPWQEDDED